jgi:hypothetical protein
MSSQPLNEGVIGRGTAQRPPEALRRSLNFFLGYLVAISFDVWVRLCTHFEAAKVMTFASVPNICESSDTQLKKIKTFFFKKKKETEDIGSLGKITSKEVILPLCVYTFVCVETVGVLENV